MKVSSNHIVMNIFSLKPNWVLLLVFSMGVFMPSCQKDADPSYGRVKIKDYWQQYDQSQVMYDLIKYDMAYVDPYSLFPEEYRAAFKVRHLELLEEFEGRNYGEVLDVLSARGQISAGFAMVMRDATAKMEAALFSSGLMETVGVLDAEVDRIQKMKEISLDDKEAATLILTMMKGTCLYYGEVYGTSLSAFNAGGGVGFRGCSIRERVWCILINGAAGAGAGFLTAVIMSAHLSPDDPLVFAGLVATLAGPAAIVGAAVGAVVGVFSQACCTPDPLNCFAVDGVSLRFASCGAAAEYRVWGFGSDDTSLNWINNGGTPAAATTSVMGMMSATLNISQDAPNIAVDTELTSVCADGTLNTTEFTRNLQIESSAVNGISLVGPTRVSPGVPYVYNGFRLTNRPNYSVQWFVNGGSIVDSFGGQATVQWDAGTTGKWLQMQVTNTCPGGQMALFTLQVTTDNADIP